MGLKTLIVDDEPVARQVLREELEEMDGVEIAGEAADGASALEAIRSLAPDLVFLDLQMPGLGGLSVLQNLPQAGHIPVVVIVTAYDQYAIQAFEAGAIDYLLKPIGQERLKQAVERAKQLRTSPGSLAQRLVDTQTAAEPPGRGLRKIVARNGDEYLILNADEVLAFEAERELVWIVTANKRYLATQPLRVLEEKLSGTNFRRVHRNALINIDQVRKLRALSSQRWLITLGNGHEFIVSKAQRRNVKDLLGL